jgi:tetratricopeptide (TPR) repeat protein
VGQAVIGTLRNFIRGCRRHPVLVVVTMLTALGVGAVVLAPTLWATYHCRRAQEALQDRDFSRARAHLMLSLKARPARSDLHFWLARTERLAGNGDEARHQLDRCEELAGPTDAVERERLLLRVQEGDLGDNEGALLARLRQDDPETDQILEALGQGYRKVYRWGDSLGCLNRLLDRRPDHAQAHLWRGQLEQRLGHFTEAAADYRCVVSLQPEDDWGRLCLGEILLFLRQPDSAAEQFEYLAGRLDDNPAVLLGLARCYRDQGRQEKAADILTQLAAQHPREGAVWTDRGMLALQMGQPAQAEEFLRRAVRLQPFDYSATYSLGQCLEQRGQAAEARTWRTRAEQLQRDRTRLEEVIRGLVRQPRGPALRCEAGQLCLRLGQFEDARGWLESALRQDPQCAAAYQGLAEYYQHGGDATTAARFRQLAAACRQSEG